MSSPPCSCPAISSDASASPKRGNGGKSGDGVWDMPCTEYVRDDDPLPLYWVSKNLHELSLRFDPLVCECLKKGWLEFKQQYATRKKQRTQSTLDPRDIHWAYVTRYIPNQIPSDGRRIRRDPASS